MRGSTAALPSGHRPLRVLHCPSSVGGNPDALAAMERAQGLESRSASIGGSDFAYPCDDLVITKGWRKALVPFHRVRLLLKALREFDVIHFNFGSTLMPMRRHLVFQAKGPARKLLVRAYNLYAGLLEFRDLPLLKRAGKVIAVTFQGDDVRQWDYCREHFRYTHAKEAEPVYMRRASDDARRRITRVFDRYADLIYALNPDLMWTLPERTKFFPYASADPSRWHFKGVECGTSRPLRIVHAPSNRAIKGTALVEAAVNRLKAEGYAVELILVEGLPNAEARRIYEQADLLVDQLYAGWYGGLSAELMSLGKPVICYIREGDLRFIPPGMAADLPIINAAPHNITEVLRETVRMTRQSLAELGVRGRAFMERWHGPEMIGRRIKADYESCFTPPA